MADQSVKTVDLPVQNGASITDRVLFIYNAANASLAQTATVAVSNLLGNTPNLAIVAANLVLGDIRTNPANSTALTVPQGTLFFSNGFGYFAISANNLVRWPVATF